MWIYWVIALSVLLSFSSCSFSSCSSIAPILVAYPHLYGMQETWEIEKEKNLVFDYEKDSERRGRDSFL
jgi:hypothetical protein